MVTGFVPYDTECVKYVTSVDKIPAKPDPSIVYMLWDGVDYSTAERYEVSSGGAGRDGPVVPYTAETLPDPASLGVGAVVSVDGEVAIVDSTSTINVSKLSKRLNGKLSIHEFMTAAQIADSSANLGTFDLSAQFAAAITAATTSDSTLYFPRGKYKVSSVPAITTKGFVIVGGANARAAQGGSEIVYTGSGSLFQLGTDDGLPYSTNSYDGPQGFGIANILLSHGAPDTALGNGNGSYKAGSYGLRDFRAGDITLENVTFEKFEYGFWGVQSDINTFARPRAFYCKTGMYIGPRSDQNVIDDFYGFFNDCAIYVDTPADTWINRPVLVANGSATTVPVVVSRGSTRTIIESPWCESLGQGYQGFITSFFSLGNVDGYGPVTTPAVGVRITNPFVYVNTQASGITVKYLADVGSAFVEVDSPTAPSGQTSNLSKTINIPKGTAYTNAQAGIKYNARINEEANAILNEGTGSQDISIVLWGYGGNAFSNNNGRFSIKKIGASAGAEELRIGQEGVVGQVVMTIPTYSTGQTNRLLLRKAYQQSNAMPTTGTFETGDYIQNTAPTIQTWTGGFAALAGAKYTVKGWIRITTGSTHVLNTDWVEDRALTGV